MAPRHWVRVGALTALLVWFGCGRETAGTCDPRYGDLLCMPGETCDFEKKKCSAGQPCTSNTDCSTGFACDPDRHICYRNCGKDVTDTFTTCDACCQAGYSCNASTLGCMQP